MTQVWTAPAPVRMEGLAKMVVRVPQAVLGKMADVEAMEVLESTAGPVETGAPGELVG